ncbi:MAG: hypothetical protein IJV83_04435 [Clostridia bacterium]|nr:hypothetical protein [Clostridia bacterium]
MIRIILCEGETDATLLGLYLEKTTSWKYNTERKPKLKMNIPQTVPLSNKKSFNYIKDNEDLLICAVGGKDNFGGFFTEYIYPMIETAHLGETDFRIALMTDADEQTVHAIETDILEQLSPNIKSIKNNTWKKNILSNKYQEKANVNFLLTVIPQEGAGALETVLLSALAEKDDGTYIVEESENFIDELEPVSYLSTDRLKLKSKLGVALSVFYPDKVFSQFDEQLQIVDWGKSKELAKCLSEIIKI